MRWLLGCLGVVFVIFGGCVLAIFSDGVAPDEVAFAVGAALILVFGIWLIYRAATRQRKPAP
jgi:ABC-type nickel/cobalt efflux system permease component RcnA